MHVRGREGQVGSHRYNRVRRERISGGSLTFPFVGSRDALGNRVIRFGTLDGRLERITTLPYGLPVIPPDKTGCFVLRRCYTWRSLTLQKGVATTKARARAPRNYSPTITAHLHRAAIAATLSKHKLFIVVAAGSDSRAEFEITC